MHYRVIRDDQEYGPYTIEEIAQYVQEGSILPNDYVHNGMEWQPVSQFLQNPHKAAASMHSISSVAKAQPQIKYTKSKYDPGDSGGESKNSLKSIVGAIIVIAFLGYNFFSNRNAEKAEKFNNGLVALLDDYALKLDSLDIEIEGDNSVVLEHLGDILMKSNDSAKALVLYKKAYGLDKENPQLKKKAYPD